MKRILLLICIGASMLLAEQLEKKCTIKPKFLHIIESQTPEGKLNAKIVYLADQLVRNLSSRYQTIPISVTSFLNLHAINKTNSLGRLIAENLQHELQVRGWNITDIRLAKNIILNSSGEYMLSRNPKKIKLQQVKLAAIVTGTYAYLRDSIIINAKLLRLRDGKILSTAQIALPITPYETELFEGEETTTIQVSGE